MERVYRFRSIERLLGPSQELERQEIYFAHPSELNDPAEGLLPFFWRGDKIVWTNFFRHYLYCLHWKCMDFLIARGHLKIQEIPLPVMEDRDFADIPMLVEIHKRAVGRILDDDKVQECIEFLSQLQHRTYKSHIIFLFQTFQGSALEAIRSAHQELDNPLPYFPDTPFDVMSLEVVPKILKQAVDVDQMGSILAENLIKLQCSQLFQTRAASTLNLSGGQSDVFMDNHNYLFFDFPRTYLEHLPILIYPDWNAACFSKNWNNPVAWASYGDNHKGVCLIFEEEHHSKIAGLTLNIKNYSAQNNVPKIVDHYKFVDVNYGLNEEKIDFFRSLYSRNLPMKILDMTCYTNDKGEHSESAMPLQDDIEPEFEEHRNHFFSSIVQKSVEWQHEEEIRLICFGNLNEAERRATYGFSSLIGVIFGIRTRDSEKKQLIDIIQHKCAEHGHGCETFEFYQAYFTDEGKIRKCQLDIPTYNGAS